MFVLEEFKSINSFVFDVDGVMTSSKLLVTESGELLRSVNTRDGQAIKYALKAGFHVAIITGGNSLGVYKRFTNLGVSQIYMNVTEKLPILKQLEQEQCWDKNHMLYMGDDIPDLSCIRYSKIGSCPQDAVDEIKDASNYISPKRGGEGCVREVIEKVMKIQDKWPIG